MARFYSCENFPLRAVQALRALGHDVLTSLEAEAAAAKKTDAFLKTYFSLRAKAGFATQADVAKKSGLSRSYVAVIESGEHIPQQKTLQKLARAFGVDVTALIA